MRKHHPAICEHQTTTDTTLNVKATLFVENTNGHTDLDTSTKAKSSVLLKTAIGQVTSGNYTTEANILFDEGVQLSFMTERLANELHVEDNGIETVHLAAFCDYSQRVRIMRTATVHIITDRKERISIDVLITPTIAAPIQNLQRDVLSLPHLRNLKLAHPMKTDEMFEISLLIGADAYWKLVQNRVVRGDEPTAVQSKLGYFLSGPLPQTHRVQPHALNVITSRPPEFHQYRPE